MVDLNSAKMMFLSYSGGHVHMYIITRKIHGRNHTFVRHEKRDCADGMRADNSDILYYYVGQGNCNECHYVVFWSGTVLWFLK